MLPRLLAVVAALGIAGAAAAAENQWPNPQSGDFLIKDYVFKSGERLPELKLHYRTLGTAKRDSAGDIANGVLLLQGNTGTGDNWLRPSLADELFKPGQPLDLERPGRGARRERPLQDGPKDGGIALRPDPQPVVEIALRAKVLRWD